MKKVIVGMSGGVDSSVAALLLKNQGFDVCGVFMKNWEEEFCSAAEDFDDVAAVCAQIGIPYYSVNFSKQYWDLVFSRCLEDYRLGLTPNPDILCNEEIKFKTFFNKALEMDADFFATGHYCQKLSHEDGPLLARGSDPSKDQSYFLHSICGKTLEKVLFPLGGLQKSEIRAIAKENGLINAEKKDSTGICFIGKRKFKDFIEQFIPKKPGLIEDQQGHVIGKHDGLAYYTLGQRKGLGIGGEGAAWFIAKKDLQRNVLIAVQGEDDPLLYSKSLEAIRPRWIQKAPQKGTYQAKVRYRQKDISCKIKDISASNIIVSFDKPQKAVTPGQSIVFYDGPICLGGAVIQSAS